MPLAKFDKFSFTFWSCRELRSARKTILLFFPRLYYVNNPMCYPFLIGGAVKYATYQIWLKFIHPLEL